MSYVAITMSLICIFIFSLKKNILKNKKTLYYIITLKNVTT